MNLRAIQAFVTIADCGTFGAAARRLHVSQPALSRQIAALAHDIGFDLFEPRGRGVRLTAQAEDLVQNCRRILAETSALQERANRLRSGQTGSLRVGATPQVIEALLADFLAQYERLEPGVEVELREAGGAQLGGLLDRAEIDLAIMPQGDRRFEAHPLYPMLLIAVLPESHPVSRNRHIEVGGLDGEPVLLLNQAFASRLWFDAACQVARCRPHVAFESSSPSTVIALARTGRGIAIVPSPVHVALHGVVVLPIVYRDEPIGRMTVVAWDGRRFLPAYGNRFVSQLVAAVQRDYPGREAVRSMPLLRPGSA
jgi:LysR family transcriptional regulator, cyn operon transcriptional activator